MDLVNTTGIPAELSVSELSEDGEGQSVRLGTLTAKVTWSVLPSGGLALTEDPLPVLAMEQPVELGFLPRDVVPPRPPGLDLVVLAAAYAPRGRPISEMTVSLQVGDVRRELAVTGDRKWERAADGSCVLGPPADFLRMPLTWERAFGGTAEVWIDDASALDVQHPYNPAGRGFDPTPHVEGIASALGCPLGFPQVRYERIAPNVEHPARCADGVDASPEPYCWAPLPVGMGLRTKWVADSLATEPPGVDHVRAAAEEDGGRVAHPDLRLNVPAPGSPVRLLGCTPFGDPWQFTWPPLQLAADYAISTRTGQRLLEPHVALLLPEQGQVSVTYRTWFRFVAVPEQERSIRLRISAGG